MKTALYLGRFQPFHLGHLQLIKKVSKKYDKVVIAICSAQKHGTRRNPFSVWVRYKMIYPTLLMENISNCEIVPVPDINHVERWAEYMKAIFGDYDVVITNNPTTRRYFEARGDKVGGFEIQRVTVTIPNAITNKSFKSTLQVSGTLVRQFILNFTKKEWEQLLPKSVSELIDKCSLDINLKDIYANSKVF